MANVLLIILTELVSADLFSGRSEDVGMAELSTIPIPATTSLLLGYLNAFVALATLLAQAAAVGAVVAP